MADSKIATFIVYFDKLYSSLLARIHSTSLIVRNSRLLRSLLPSFIFLISYFFFYHGFFNSVNDAFPDLGPFPLYPSQSDRLYYYLWQISGFGFAGSQLPYGIIINSMTKLFADPGVAEKIWFLSLLPIAFFGSFFLQRITFQASYKRSLFLSFIYVFNPITAGLIYEGSVNDTLTAYVFIPLLFLFAIGSLNDKNDISKRLESTLILCVLFIYVYYWNQQIIMWLGPFYFFLALFHLYSLTNLRRRIISILNIVVFTTTFVILSGSLSVIAGFLALKGYVVFSPISGGSVTDLAVVISENFKSQFSFEYWYLGAGVLCIILFFFQPPRGIRSERLLGQVHSSIVVSCLLVLGIWVVFEVDYNRLVLFLVRYLPIVAAYEPFPGIVLLFALLFIDLSIVRPNSSAGELLKELIASDKQRGRLFRRLAKKLIAIGLVVLLLFSNAPFWNDTGLPSTIGMINSSSVANDYYSVPQSIINVSQWLHSNFHSSQEGRVLVIPDVGYSQGELQDLNPTVSFLPITSSMYETLNYMLQTNNTANLANFLSIFGVEYVILLKGNYPQGDTQSSLVGPARFQASGFEWDLNYEPIGSWASWNKLVSAGDNFSLVLNSSYSSIYSNNLFLGTLFTFSLQGQSVLRNVIHGFSSNTIEYDVGGNLLSLNWTGINLIPWKYNWSIHTDFLAAKSSNYITLIGGPLPSNVSYSNLWQMPNLRSNTSYDLSFSIKGSFMQDSSVWIRYYSGANMSGTVISTTGLSFHGNISQSKSVHFRFKTPQSFGSVAIFPTYLRNKQFNNESYTVFSNFSLLETEISTAIALNYSFNNPTHATLLLNLRPLTKLIVFASAFSPDWELISNSDVVIKPFAFNNGYITEMAFLLNNSTGEFSLVFTPQSGYEQSLSYRAYGWSVLMGLTAFSVLWTERRKRVR